MYRLREQAKIGTLEHGNRITYLVAIVLQMVFYSTIRYDKIRSEGRKLKMTQGKLLTPEQVAEQLSVSVLSVKRWLREGKMQGVKVAGKVWRIEPESLQRFIEEHRTGRK